MNYEEALEYLYSFANTEKMKAGAFAAGHFQLERIERILEALGNPQQAYPSVLIAGTKGKGSTAVMTEAVLRQAGYRTGLYTQPHLHTFRERIKVVGKLIDKDRLAAITTRISRLVEHGDWSGLTTYELATALAFQYFKEEQIEIAVLEVGLGGRLDSTNVVTPLVSVITSISLDHVAILGGTVAEIASEKAGIIKPGGTILTVPQTPEAQQVIEQAAHNAGARLFTVGKDVLISQPAEQLPNPRGAYGQWLAVSFAPDFPRAGAGPETVDIWIPLLGAHQQINAATALGVIRLIGPCGFAVSGEAIRKGLASVEWPARLEIVSENPRIVVDGAHNADSARKLAAALRNELGYRRLILIVGTSSDKDIPGIMEALVPQAALTIVTKSNHPRAAATETLAAEASKHSTNVTQAGDPSQALELAREAAGPGDLVCATGSLFLAA
ncbi:MAG: bifunctional folylpolyglutamate synthase/dihydrofolate synthase, partial [Chloroflexi bacterium]|nr:bifunctional folylpolyglutamate synthase/dihydrofolate synthase [Chloroflexota bacterium]